MQRDRGGDAGTRPHDVIIDPLWDEDINSHTLWYAAVTLWLIQDYVTFYTILWDYYVTKWYYVTFYDIVWDYVTFCKSVWLYKMRLCDNI